jgi:hypothetical protein
MEKLERWIVVLCGSLLLIQCAGAIVNVKIERNERAYQDAKWFQSLLNDPECVAIFKIARGIRP